MRQTHISYVFLAGPYVYKIKKSLRLPFLDYSTLAKREFFCREEIRLNRRLAPAIYLQIVPVLQHGETFALADGYSAADHIVEYAVKMKRLPHDRILDVRVQRDSVAPDEIQAIARKSATFHKTAPANKAAEFGSQRSIRARVLANFSRNSSVH